MIELSYVPVGKDRMQEWYGHPPVYIVNGRLIADRAWWKKNMTRITLPYRLELDYALGTYMVRPWVHKHIAKALIDAFAEILDFYGIEEIERFHLNRSNGIYMRKYQHGASDTLSLHAYAVAIDICPNYGGWGEKTRMPYPIHKAFDGRGFVNYPHVDGMHYQAAEGI